MQAPFDPKPFLTALGIPTLNPMQAATLSAAATHNNLVLLSPTGSGKTLAFLLPLLQALKPAQKGTQALIVTPSRELALQIEEVFRKMKTGLKVLACYGGHKRELEENSLKVPPTLIVGTPGRLGDHLRRNNLTHESIHTLVLDEFDKSLELGFQEELEFVLQSLPGIERRILTSATRSNIPDFVGMTPVEVLDFRAGNAEESEAADQRLTVQYVRCDGKDKLETLLALLCHLGRGPVIIFCNHRESVERTAAFLAEKSIAHVWYHGALEQRDREAALARFRNGSASFLVTTDLAARGLDIPHIRAVIHYHLPHTEAEFTHRNGRTARMEASGSAILLLGPEEELPDFVPTDCSPLELIADAPLPKKPEWATLFVGAGKKEKVNKVDIVGFLTKQGGLRGEDVGLIEVREHFSFVAVRRSRASAVLAAVKEAKLKGRKTKVEMAKG